MFGRDHSCCKKIADCQGRVRSIGVGARRPPPRPVDSVGTVRSVARRAAGYHVASIKYLDDFVCTLARVDARFSPHCQSSFFRALSGKGFLSRSYRFAKLRRPQAVQCRGERSAALAVKVTSGPHGGERNAAIRDCHLAPFYIPYILQQLADDLCRCRSCTNGVVTLNSKPTLFSEHAAVGTMAATAQRP